MIIFSNESLYYLFTNLNNEEELVKFSHNNEEILLLYRLFENGKFFYVINNKVQNLLLKISEDDLLNKFFIKTSELKNIPIISIETDNLFKSRFLINNRIIDVKYSFPLINLLTLKEYLVICYKAQGIDISDEELNEVALILKEGIDNILKSKGTTDEDI